MKLLCPGPTGGITRIFHPLVLICLILVLSFGQQNHYGGKISVEQYMKQITNWSCTEPSPMVIKIMSQSNCVNNYMYRNASVGQSVSDDVT